MSYPLGYLGQDAPPPPPAAAPGRAQGGVIPGPLPGTLYVPGVGMLEVKDWTETVIYDTELITTPVAAGDRYTFFRNLSFPTGVRKIQRYTNMITPQQLPSKWRAIVYGMHFQILPEETAVAGVFTTVDDVQRIMSEAYCEFLTGNQKVEKEGPIIMWPCPYGLTGTFGTTGPAAREWGWINNGVAAIGAMPPSKIIVDLIDELTFFSTATFETALILDNDVLLQCVLRAFVSKPVR